MYSIIFGLMHIAGPCVVRSVIHYLCLHTLTEMVTRSYFMMDPAGRILLLPIKGRTRKTRWAFHRRKSMPVFGNESSWNGKGYSGSPRVAQDRYEHGPIQNHKLHESITKLSLHFVFVTWSHSFQACTLQMPGTRNPLRMKGRQYIWGKSSALSHFPA